MAIFQLKTFSDIYTYVLNELKIQTGDTTSLNRAKRIINAVYLDEVVPYEKWEWLHDSVNLVMPAKTSGTASVTENSTSVTLSSAPSNTVEGYLFKTEAHDEIYTVATHNGGSAVLTLTSEYTDTTDSSVNFDLWTDRLSLPSDCLEVVSVTHDYSPEPVRRVGLSKLRKLSTMLPNKETRPNFYAVGDWVDPAPFDTTVTSSVAVSTRESAGLLRTLTFGADVSSNLSAGNRIQVSSAGDDSYNGVFIVSSVSSATVTYTGLSVKTESATSDTGIVVKSQGQESDLERARQLLLYPSRNDDKTTLHVDYKRQALPLENDADEPLIPLGDRIVLVYGALMHAWRSLHRNPEEAATNSQLYTRKLSLMQSRNDAMNENPILEPDRDYVNSKRNPGLIRRLYFGSFLRND